MLTNLIILTGIPGTGKTTISKQLESGSNWINFPLGDYILQNKLYLGEDTNRDTKIVDMDIAGIEGFLEILRIICRNYANFQDKGLEPLNIVIDSHYADVILDGIEDFKENPEKYTGILKKENFTIEKINENLNQFYEHQNIIGIILRCEPEELNRRLSKRPYSEIKIQENIQAEILGEANQNLIEVLENDKIFEINSEEHTIEEIVEIIQDLAKNNTSTKNKYKIGKINWLDKLNEQGNLNEYFNNGVGNSRELKLDLNESEENNDDKIKRVE